MSTAIKISLKSQTVASLNSDDDEDDEDKTIKEEQNDSNYSDVNKGSSVFDTSEYIEDGFDAFDDDLQEDESGFEGLDVEESTDCDFDNIEPSISYSSQQEFQKFGDLLGNEDSNGTGTDSDYNTLIHRADPNHLYEGSDKSPADESSETKEQPEETKITSCSINPNFAIVVDFIEKFGDHIGLKNIPMKELEAMICDNSDTVHPDLVQLHTVLLKKIKLSKKLIITKKSWIKGLILFCNGAGGMIYEALEIQNLGYSRLSVSAKLELLKVLMESQFDWNELVRALVEDLPVEALRNEPSGRDIDGQRYWTQVTIT